MRLKRMRLSKRIYAVAGKVKQGETVADIGTDHGYVPMLLLRDKISPRVIMSDISADSLEKARETFAMTALDVRADDFRVGSGLDTLSAGETDCAVIAGLGGFTIIEILAKDSAKSRSFSRIILQPRKHSGNLRYFLYVNGWDILDEDLVREGKFICEIITAAPSELTERKPPFPESDIRWKYPPELVLKQPELAAERLEWKIQSLTDELDSLASSRKDQTVLMSTLESDREYLNALRKSCLESLKEREDEEA